MQCLHPFVIKNPNLMVNGDMRQTIEVPCGHCVSCRIARSREWAVRLLHESEFWEEYCFVTLTYSDDNLVSASLVPRDLTLFFKKLRRDLGDKKLSISLVVNMAIGSDVLIFTLLFSVLVHLTRS